MSLTLVGALMMGVNSTREVIIIVFIFNKGNGNY